MKLKSSISKRKWIDPLLLLVLLGLALLLAKFEGPSPSAPSLVQMASGTAIFLSGSALYLYLYPRAGLSQLLLFFFLSGIFIIFRALPLLSPWAFPALAYLAPLFLDFSLLISESLVERKGKTGFFLAFYIFSALLSAFYLASPEHSQLRRSLEIFAVSLLLLVYLSWLFRLERIQAKPRLLFDQAWARYLLRGQVLVFSLPFLATLVVEIWLQRLALAWLAPAFLFFPLALAAGIYPGKKRQAEVYIVQSEKRRSFGDLLAGLTHELNNPLTFIYSNMEPMKEMLQELKARLPEQDEKGRQIAEELERLADNMEEGSQRAKGLIDQFRSFPKARPEQKEEVDLIPLLDKTIDLLEPKWKGRIEIIRNWGEVPKVRGFAGELGQVFTNLIANACDATAPGGQVKVSTQRMPGGASVLVKDSGKGIAREHISQVFDPFFTTKDQGEGTGLGLAISMQIIKSHKGSIEVQSEEGRGSEFLVFLPVST